MKNRLFAAAAMILFAGVAVADDARPDWESDIRREDLGSKRRIALTQMELKPVAADMFGTLGNWTGGSAVTSDAMKGKVVLVLNFAAWEPNSQKAFDRAAKLADTYAGKGLVVVAVHGAKMWDDAVALAKEKNFKGLLAQDDGKLRSKMMIDEEPDFYLIDRAGNMRYADFETDSLNRAVERTVGETPEVAASQSSLLKAAIAKAKKDFDTPEAIKDVLKPKGLGKVDFKLPDAGVYEKAAWPEKNKDQQGLGANDVQGQRLPNADEFGQKVIWFTPKPDWAGKVIIIDFWATWCVPCKRSMPMIEDLARKYKDDLCVIGFTGQGETDKVVEAFLRKHDSVYSHCYDAKMFENEQRQPLSEKLSLRGIPHVIIISSDGIVRWQGHPLDPRFRRWAELIIEIDPGVQARRNAEQAALKAAGAGG